MRNDVSGVQVGDIVRAAPESCAPEDDEPGTVVAVNGAWADVAWESGTRSTVRIDGLRKGDR